MPGRSAVTRVGRVRVLRHRVHAGSRRGLRGVLVTGQVVARVWSVRGAWSPRRMRVATVERLHGGGWGLQRRKRLRQGRSRLKLVGGYGRWRWICLWRRGRAYTIRRIMRTVHTIPSQDASRGEEVGRRGTQRAGGGGVESGDGTKAVDNRRSARRERIRDPETCEKPLRGPRERCEKAVAGRWMRRLKTGPSQDVWCLGEGSRSGDLGRDPFLFFPGLRRGDDRQEQAAAQGKKRAGNVGRGVR